MTNSRNRLPVEPVDQKTRDRLISLPGFFIFGRPPGGNAWQGYVEHSFSMGWSRTHANFWAATRLDDVQHYLAAALQLYPDWEIKLVDCRADELGLIYDWARWIDAQAFDPNTLSGVSDKFAARNVPFKMPDDLATAAQRASKEGKSDG